MSGKKPVKLTKQELDSIKNKRTHRIPVHKLAKLMHEKETGKKVEDVDWDDDYSGRGDGEFKDG